MRRHSALLFAVAISALPASAFGAPLALDQQNLGEVARLNADTNRIVWQQGVTAGLTGGLTQIDLNIVSLQTDALDHDLPVSGSIDVFINLGAPWQNDASEFEQIVSVTASWNSITLPSPLFMTAGTQFTIGVHGFGNPPAPLVGLWSDGGNAYAGGQLFVEVDGSRDSFNSMDFRTWVDTSVVATPEPATIGLLSCGLVGIIRRRRDR